MNKKLLIFLGLFFLQSYFSQNVNAKYLFNTRWKLVSHFVNAGTWSFVPLSEKATTKSEFDFIIFDENNGYHYHNSIGKSCKMEYYGKYSVEKSHIIFNDTSTKIEGNCDRLDDFRLRKKAIVLKTNYLYLTEPDEWYDEEIKKNGDTILLKGLGKIRPDRENGKYILNDAHEIPLNDGIYKAISPEDSQASYTFSVKNNVLDGTSVIIGKGMKMEFQYDNGILVSEKGWKNKQLFKEMSESKSVKKDGKDYIITLTKLSRNSSRDKKDSTITVFRNEKPVLKKRFSYNSLMTEKDFTKNSFKEYDINGKLKISNEPGVSIEYDYSGRERKKELYKKGSYELYKYGVIVMRKTFDKDSTTITTYDEKGNLLETKKESKNNIVEATMANPDEYERDLTVEQLEYYKSFAK